MHAAAALAVLGFLGTVPGLIKFFRMLGGAEVARPAAVRSQAIMAVLCVVFVILCVRSFIAARAAQDRRHAPDRLNRSRPPSRVRTSRPFRNARSGAPLRSAPGLVADEPFAGLTHFTERRPY